MSQYFLTAMVLSGEGSGQGDPAQLRFQALQRPHQGTLIVASWPMSLNPGGAEGFDFSVYYGPKDNQALETAGH